tara:strand:- start:829 stop:1353 length:525 start_codon:yes stop_codon:yes gene_type:complete
MLFEITTMKGIKMANKSRASRLMYHLSKYPMKYKEMQTFIWNLNGHKGKAQQGYWCDGITILKGNNLIEKIDGLYYLTELGKLNMDKPMSHRTNLIHNATTEGLMELRKLKSDIKSYQQQLCSLQHENALLILELSEHHLSQELEYLRKLNGYANPKDSKIILRLIEKVKAEME